MPTFSTIRAKHKRRRSIQPNGTTCRYSKSYTTAEFFNLTDKTNVNKTKIDKIYLLIQKVSNTQIFVCLLQENERHTGFQVETDCLYSWFKRKSSELQHSKRCWAEKWLSVLSEVYSRGEFQGGPLLPLNIWDIKRGRPHTTHTLSAGEWFHQRTWKCLKCE